ncbi:hypothetical protein BKA70DRAFT_1241921 [Coprinopsis sp. MPI-PUGE-AT-0042]|nr:hypothetical protein BKA70DRAFT_1241921 [Coprinopsis sp. MPI-PUGE-AT-0042]
MGKLIDLMEQRQCPHKFPRRKGDELETGLTGLNEPELKPLAGACADGGADGASLTPSSHPPVVLKPIDLHLQGLHLYRAWWVVFWCWCWRIHWSKHAQRERVEAETSLGEELDGGERSGKLEVERPTTTQAEHVSPLWTVEW